MYEEKLKELEALLFESKPISFEIPDEISKEDITLLLEKYSEGRVRLGMLIYQHLVNKSECSNNFLKFNYCFCKYFLNEKEKENLDDVIKRCCTK